MRALICAAVLLTVFVYSQDSEVELPLGPDGRVTYEAVVTVTGLTADSLQNKARNWIKSFFKNPSEALKKDEPGKLVVEYKLRIYDHDPKTGRKYFRGNVKYTLYLFFRDGKFKYRITNFRYLSNRAVPIEEWLDSNDERIKSYLRQIDEYTTELITNLRTYMKTTPKEYNPEEW